MNQKIVLTQDISHFQYIDLSIRNYLFIIITNINCLPQIANIPIPKLLLDSTESLLILLKHFYW